ncbi:hypothetical protein HG535_0C01640 [Zygotorulaspora mrakii]|uniref:Trafficking protein particle complex subunit n=1 Tax=Zygotorulaspora mrakii TaxID=42260 RepID=A0A7H9AZG2_ZYGMR|nr:uncharacterized protein HG535_0C01640 [Zygotorulaspora mrakii]QLG71815.1 hypothetical protein HG535_0C01640 [Zygotorulaspora mrakii]
MPQAVLVINKSGGLIYHRDFEEVEVEVEDRNKPSSNDLLILASTLHSTFAIASQLTPKAIQLQQQPLPNLVPYVPMIDPDNLVPRKKLGSFKGDDYFKEPFQNWNKSGIRSIKTDQFTVYIYQSLTGLKLVAMVSNRSDTINETVVNNLLRRIYCLYSDYVMKDPFYSLEMPIKSELFDTKLRNLVKQL